MEKAKIEELKAILKRNPQILDSLHPLEREIAVKITGLDISGRKPSAGLPVKHSPK